MCILTSGNITGVLVYIVLFLDYCISSCYWILSIFKVIYFKNSLNRVFQLANPHKTSFYLAVAVC